MTYMKGNYILWTQGANFHWKLHLWKWSSILKHLQSPGTQKLHRWTLTTCVQYLFCNWELGSYIYGNLINIKMNHLRIQRASLVIKKCSNIYLAKKMIIFNLRFMSNLIIHHPVAYRWLVHMHLCCNWEIIILPKKKRLFCIQHMLPFVSILRLCTVTSSPSR